ncbi:hypothetical protein B0H13DRAFT_2275516 [Mycena leptocephala]|nr:hypothetical protein B0H13DRAFT_2275516 [Mycena leptocephala]
MGKNNRKTKREQAAKLLAAGFAHTDEEDAGGQPVQRSQSSSTTRPPDALVASSLEPERGTTPIAQSPQSGHRWASSPLPPLTPSRSERAVKAMLSSPMDPSVEIQSETGRRATSESFATSLRRDSVDFNEAPHSGVRSAVSEPILHSDRLQEACSVVLHSTLLGLYSVLYFLLKNMVHSEDLVQPMGFKISKLPALGKYFAICG